MRSPWRRCTSTATGTVGSAGRKAHPPAPRRPRSRRWRVSPASAARGWAAPLPTGAGALLTAGTRCPASHELHAGTPTNRAKAAQCRHAALAHHQITNHSPSFPQDPKPATNSQRPDNHGLFAAVGCGNDELMHAARPAGGASAAWPSRAGRCLSPARTPPALTRRLGVPDPPPILDGQALDAQLALSPQLTRACPATRARDADPGARRARRPRSTTARWRAAQRA